MLAGNAKRIADGEELLEPSQPSGIDEFSQSMALARIHQYLSMATPLLWTRQQDTIGVLGLALNACYERNGSRRSSSRSRSLTTARPLACRRSRTKVTWRRAAVTFALVHLADIIAVTPGA